MEQHRKKHINKTISLIPIKYDKQVIFYQVTETCTYDMNESFTHRLFLTDTKTWMIYRNRNRATMMFHFIIIISLSLSLSIYYTNLLIFSLRPARSAQTKWILQTAIVLMLYFFTVCHTYFPTFFFFIRKNIFTFKILSRYFKQHNKTSKKKKRWINTVTLFVSCWKWLIYRHRNRNERKLVWRIAKRAHRK